MWDFCTIIQITGFKVYDNIYIYIVPIPVNYSAVLNTIKHICIKSSSSQQFYQFLVSYSSKESIRKWNKQGQTKMCQILVYNSLRMFNNGKWFPSYIIDQEQ